MWTALRTVETRANADGSATTHVVVRCTLADVARACNLRVEDAAFALNECGLLVRRLPPKPAPDVNANSKHAPNAGDVDGGTGAGTGAGMGAGPGNSNNNTNNNNAGETLAITREMVEAVAREREVKRMCMDLAHVLL